MDLNKLDVIKTANKGSILELKSPVDYSENGVLLFEVGDVLNDCSDKVGKGEPKNKGKSFFVRLLGADSDTYRSISKRKMEKSFNQNKQIKNKIDMDSLERETAEKLAKCTTECYFVENGKPVECTVSELTRVYLQYPWIREQAIAFSEERSNFTAS